MSLLSVCRIKMFSRQCVIYTLVGLLHLAAPSVWAEPKSSYKVAVESGDPVSQILFNSLSKDTGIAFEFIKFDQFSAALEAVKSGQIDFLTNVIYSKERAETLDFTAPTNIEYVYFFTPDHLPLSQAQILAVPANSIYHFTLLEGYPEFRFVEFSDVSEAAELLHSGSVDGVIAGLSKLELMTVDGIDAALVDELSLNPVSVVAPKGKHVELLKTIEEHAHSGEFQKLLRESTEQYQINVRKQALRKEVIQRGIDINEPLRVKLENIKLFVNYHNDNHVDGITADILYEVCELLQLDCQLASHADEAWSSMYQSLENQSIDVLSPLAITDARKALFYLSDGYYSPEAILVKRKHYKDDVYRSISEMLIERIGVVGGNFFESLLRDKLPGKELYLYSSQAELLDGLLNQEVDYILITRAAFNSKLREAKSTLQITEEKKVGVIHSYDLAFGFPKTEQGKHLSELFSKAINIININNIVNKYDYPPDWYSTINAQKKISRNGIIRFGFIISLLLLVLFVFYKRSITDELTRLRNRLAIYRKYGRLFPSHKTLIYVDVNKFKSINDRYGHRVGDLVLKHLATKIIRHWKGEAYRIGGDEFVLVSKESKEQIEQRLTKLTTFSFVERRSQDELVVTTSVGMATDLEKSLPLDEVLNVADKSMYKAKARFRRSKRAS